MTLPKLKSAWYSNRGCFSQGLCRICWMVAGSAINRSVSVFNPIASIKTQKDICKTRLLPGEKAWPRLLRYFSQSWCWALCRISLSRLSCSLKFALVFYILLQGCLLWSPSCYVAEKFKEERRERYLLFSFAPLPFCWISRWRPKIKKNTKIQLNTTKIMTNCLHQVMLPKKPFVRPFQKSSTIIDLPFATTAFANSVASVCDDDMSKFSIKHSKYGGLFWIHDFPFITFPLTFHPLWITEIDARPFAKNAVITDAMLQLPAILQQICHGLVFWRSYPVWPW